MATIPLDDSPTACLRRVLIVSPHFPPVNAPDSQRVRLALPYLQEFGWQAEVLTVQADRVEHSCDPLLLKTLPPEVPLTCTNALPAALTRKVGLGNLGWRCWPYLAAAGQRLLASRTFDLVFFSTTIFPTMALGPLWYRRFGVPYVLDFQDPWRVEGSPSSQRPGGRLKYAVDKWMAQCLEPGVVGLAAHIVSVSPAYTEVLQRRYTGLKPEQLTILPFAAPERDFELLPRLQVQQPIFNPQDGRRHWVYVGRGGADMALALRSLFQAIASDRQQNPEPWQSIQLHFVGTSYAPGQRAVKTVETIAEEMGIGDLVQEHPHRIPYFAAQQLLVDSEAILLIGSSDASYTASKLYPAILARKPILAVFHHQSSVVSILQACQAGRVVTFRDEDSPSQLQAPLRAAIGWLRDLPQPYQPPTDWAAFHPYTAREMTRKLCAAFDRSLTYSPQPVLGVRP